MSCKKTEIQGWRYQNITETKGKADARWWAAQCGNNGPDLFEEPPVYDSSASRRLTSQEISTAAELLKQL